jgi:hypothetical protein
MRRLVIYGAITLLVAAFIIMAAQFTLRPSMPAEKTGILALKITDSPPFTKPTSLNITIDSIMVHKEGSSNETWTTFPLDGNRTFDLVKLENVTDLIGASKLPVGNYTMIKMHVSRAVANLKGEEGVELTVPSDYLKIPVRFTIKDDKTTIIVLDFTYDSVGVSTHHNLSPVVHATAEKQP